MMEEKLDKTAQNIQDIHYQLFCGSSYDKIPKEKLHLFVEILAHYISKEEARKISAKVIRKDNDLIYRILIINCLVGDTLFHVPVIRVLENGRVMFYDYCCRRYSDWEDFLCCNKLPGGLMIYPVSGSYNKRNGEIELGKRKSPAAKIPSRVDDGLCLAAEVVGGISLILSLFSFSKPYATYIKMASGISEGYKVGHHANQLYDRYKHGQPVDFSDENASRHWCHIGNGFLSFASTYWRLENGNASKLGDAKNFSNLVRILYREWDKKNFAGSLNIIRGHMLSHHMLDFHPKTLKIYDNDVDLNRLVSGLRSFLGDKGNTFRKLIYVDDGALRKVQQDIKNCDNVHGIQNLGYEFAKEKEKIVTKIQEEVYAWKCEKITNNQLEFRIKGICKNGYKTYETLPELCHHYEVDDLENIVINGKAIFQNVGARKIELENLVNRASKQYPQLLSYAVEYVSKNNAVDWDMFKPHFRNKLMEEINSFPTTWKISNVSWINAINFDEVSLCNKTFENRIDFIRPSGKSKDVCIQDLINLGKKLLGIISESFLDMLIADPVTNWIVMISKGKKWLVFIGPKVQMEKIALNNSYPVFIRAF